MSATALASLLDLHPNTITNYCARSVRPDRGVQLEMERHHKEMRDLVLGITPIE